MKDRRGRKRGQREIKNLNGDWNLERGEGFGK